PDDMAIKATEISDLIKQRIENVQSITEARNVGSIVSVTDGITRIHGLADACYGEMLEFPGNTFGLALNLEQDSVGAVVLGEYKHLKEGDTVRSEEHTSELQSHLISYAVFCLKKKKKNDKVERT